VHSGRRQLNTHAGIFESREEIMQNATAEMNTIPKEVFQKCFRQWKHRWAKCVEAQGAYFEGD
jgi:hypothetical protein